MFLGETRTNARLKKLSLIVDEINSYEAAFEALTDEQLKAKTSEFKERLEGGETLDDLLPEAFAVVREAGKRTIGLRHYDIQMIGGMTLHKGRIAEMRTGEGKTLVATLPVYLNAITGRGVHVVTVNDYLARRDCPLDGSDLPIPRINRGCAANGDPHGKTAKKPFSLTLRKPTHVKT